MDPLASSGSSVPTVTAMKAVKKLSSAESIRGCHQRYFFTFLGTVGSASQIRKIRHRTDVPMGVVDERV
jgi:hypothetical protein